MTLDGVLIAKVKGAAPRTRLIGPDGSYVKGAMTQLRQDIQEQDKGFSLIVPEVHVRKDLGRTNNYDTN